MSAVHFAEADVDDEARVQTRVRFSCSGDDTSECHQWCAEGCEEQCLGYGTHRWTAEAYRPGGCRIVDWLDATGAEDSYTGDDYAPHGQPQPFRPGRHQIETEWTGDEYVWSYFEAEPAVPGRPV